MYSLRTHYCVPPPRGRDVKQFDALNRLVSSNSLALKSDGQGQERLQVDGLVQRIYMRIGQKGINAAAPVSCVDIGDLLLPPCPAPNLIHPAVSR